MKEVLPEVGVELELFLMRGGKVVEPASFGFPADEMGFLVELRSWPSENVSDITSSLEELYSFADKKAKKLGMELVRAPTMAFDESFVEYLWAKYQYDQMPDHTRNIYAADGPRKSHHVGLFGNKATSGIHVHFSLREIGARGLTARVLPLQYREITKAMDDAFEREIKEAGRLAGEYELKTHGFEYRSLPCTVSVEDAASAALDILDRFKDK